MNSESVSLLLGGVSYVLEKMSEPCGEAVWLVGREVVHDAKASEKWSENLAGFISPDDARATQWETEVPV